MLELHALRLVEMQLTLRVIPLHARVTAAKLFRYHPGVDRYH
jgi:hypothetical protein